MNEWLSQVSEWLWVPSGFRYPWVLLLEAIPVTLLVWTWWRRGRGVPLPVDYSAAATGRWWRAIVNSASSLAPLLLGVAIWLAAGPLQLGKPQAQRKMTNILFCVDVSGSMGMPFGSGTRYDASMKAIESFIDRRSGDAFGLQFFGNSAIRWTPLTTDPSAIKCALPFMRPDVVPIWMAGTAIGTSMLDARRVLLEQPEGDRMVIVVTDGVSPDLMGGNDVEIGREMAEAQIVVYGIHVAEGDPPDEVLRLAAKTGGDVFAADDQAGLEEVFAKIDSMQKAEIERTVAEQQDHFQPYAALGLLLLLAWLLASFGWRYTPW